MAQRFVDSFDHYDTNFIIKKWTNRSGNTSTFVAGRTGNGVQLTNTTLEKTIDYQPEWFVGFAFKVVGTGNFVGQLYQLYSNNQVIMTLQVHNDGTFGVSTAFDEHTTGVTPSTFSIHASTWYYCEVHNKLSDRGDGGIQIDVQVRINTDVIIDASAVYTGRNIADTTINLPKANFHWFSALTFGSVIFDDLYINDHTGGIHDDYYGDVRIGCVYTNGDVLTPWNSTGTPSYQQVNEHVPDDDASNISSATPGQIEVFDWENIATFDGTVKGVQYLIYARKDGAGARAIAHVTGDTGTEDTGPTTFVGDDYLYYIRTYDQDPAGGDWTQANFNAKRFGVKLVS